MPAYYNKACLQQVSWLRFVGFLNDSLFCNTLHKILSILSFNMFFDSNNPLLNHLCIWACFIVQWLSQVKILNQKLCVIILRRNLVSPELAKPSYQLLLQRESIQTSLLSIQIDKYKMSHFRWWLLSLPFDWTSFEW